jgi:hypothetical protein
MLPCTRRDYGASPNRRSTEKGGFDFPTELDFEINKRHSGPERPFLRFRMPPFPSLDPFVVRCLSTISPPTPCGYNFEEYHTLQSLFLDDAANGRAFAFPQSENGSETSARETSGFTSQDVFRMSSDRCGPYIWMVIISKKPNCLV